MCKTFSLTLEKSALSWFQELRPNSAASYRQLAQMFLVSFTISRVKPESKEVLRAVWQGEKKSIREHVERFNKEASHVRNLDDKQRPFWMKGGLRNGSLFQVNIGLNKPRS